MKCMKSICFVLFLSLSISCDKTDSEFKLQSSNPVERGRNCLTEKDCFYLSADTNLGYYSLSYSQGEYEGKLALDSLHDTDMQYGSILYGFKSTRDSSYVIVWKIEHEHFPSFIVYYLKDGRITKLGDWGFFTPCETCDVQDYPVKDIRIAQRNDKIEFLFQKDVAFVDYGESLYNKDWGLFKAGELKLSFNILK